MSIDSKCSEPDDELERHAARRGAVGVDLIVAATTAERASAELALRESEARYRALATASADVLYRMSADWSEMRQLDGKGILSDTAESSNAWLSRYIHPDDQRQVMDAIREAVREKRPFTLEHRVVRADGTLGWTSSRAVPLLDADGAIVEWIGAASDITARREAEDALRASETRYHALFDAIDEGFCIVELIPDAAGGPPDLVFREVNSAFERQSGLADVVGRSIPAMMPHYERDWLDLVIRVAETGVPERVEGHQRDTDRWYRGHYSRIGGPRSRLVAIVFEDVTARKRTEAALRESEERQKFLLALSDALAPLADAEQVKAVATRRLGEYLGIDRLIYGEYVHQDGRDYWRLENSYVRPGGVPFPEGLHPIEYFGPQSQTALADRAQVVDDIETYPDVSPEARATYRAMGVRSLAAVMLVKGGRFVASLAAHHGAPRPWTPEELTLVEAVAERTWAAVERSRAEQAAEQAEVVASRDALRRQLLEAEEAERRRLARELHDEAGQHLTALGLGLQRLSDVAPPGSEVDRRAAELRVLANTLGRELHAVAVRLRPKALDDFGLEAALGAYAEEWARQTGIPVDLHARDGADRLPGAIESAIYRMVQEALTNVARHSGATRASVVVERSDGRVVAIVEDDGHGFDSEESESPPDGESPKGAWGGLGLLGIRERAALLGGTVDVESAPNRGTAVFVRIPIRVPTFITSTADGNDSRSNADTA